MFKISADLGYPIYLQLLNHNCSHNKQICINIEIRKTNENLGSFAQLKDYRFSYNYNKNNVL